MGGSIVCADSAGDLGGIYCRIRCSMADLSNGGAGGGVVGCSPCSLAEVLGGSGAGGGALGFFDVVLSYFCTGVILSCQREKELLSN